MSIIKKFFKFLFNMKYYLIYWNRFKELSEKDLTYLIKKQFKMRFNYNLDLDNPKTYNEKIAWLKLYNQNPIITKCADKVSARDYYINATHDSEKHMVKQIGVYDSAEEIDFEKLPNSFVLKSNWGSGCQIIVKDKLKIDIQKTKTEINSWMDIRKNLYYSSFEFGYKNIIPKIVCEELLDFQYKLEFFCFNGDPKFFWIVLNDKTIETKANFYWLNWEQIPLYNHYPNFEEKIEIPTCYEEILQISKKLCGDFPFVRCDFYITKDDYKFSEMTFYHWGGLEHFTPNQYDKIFGDFIKLPDVKTIENTIKEK